MQSLMKIIVSLLVLLLQCELAFCIGIGVPDEFAKFPGDSFPEVLWDAGFWEASVDSQRADTVFVTLGRPAVIALASINSSDSIKPLIHQELTVRIGDTVKATSIERQQDLFVTALEDHGYPFASCTTHFAPGERIDKIPVKVVFDIEEGEKVIIERLEAQVEGITKNSVIEHGMLFRSGRVYRRSDVIAGAARLRRMGIVSISGEPYPALDPQGIWTLVVRCKDLQSTMVSGVLGYADDEIAGDMEFTSRNLFGTGRSAEFALAATENNRTIEIFYQEPFLWSSNISPQIASSWDVRDSSYMKREHSLGISFPLGFNVNGYLGFQTSRTIPRCETSSVSHGESFGIKTFMEYSDLDDPVLPTNGTLMSSFTTAEYLHFWGDESNEDFGSQAEANLLVVHKWRYFAFWFEVSACGWLYPTLPPESEWKFLGGWKTLRGYREDQFSGIRMFWETFEPRFVPVEGVHIFPFIDLGCYRDYENWHTKYGYGGGIEYRYGAGVFSIEYGIGEGRSFKNGLLHFGLRMNL